MYTRPCLNQTEGTQRSVVILSRRRFFDTSNRMEKNGEEYMTAEELRNRLYHSLRDRGLVDALKSQLRNKLVTELQQSTRGKLSLRDLKVPEEGSLLHKAANSLVADHLRRCKYDYTFSVFLPESGTPEDKIFGTPDLLKLLNVSSQSQLYKKMMSATQDHSKKGFLWQLLCELSALYAGYKNENGVQTDLIKVGPVTALDEKLHDVDEFYSSQIQDQCKTSALALEDRILSFQRTLEDRYRTDLKLEVSRIKENEISKIRMEEKEKCRKEMEQLRRELERTYQMKSDALLLKERNSIERLQREQETQEKEVYSQRQSILEEIEALRQRETHIKREGEVIDREKRLHEERLKAREQEVRKKEQDVKRKDVEFEQRLHNEMTKFKVEQQAKYMERAQNVELRECRVKDEEQRVGEEKDKIQTVKDQLRDKTARVNELETLLQEDKHKEMSAVRQNEYLNAKLRDMADYKTIKEHNAVMRNELETVKMRLSEVLQMNERERTRQEEMIREMRRPTSDTLMMHREFEKSRQSLKQDQVLFDHQKQQLEKKLQEEVDRNRELLRRFEEQTFQMKDMNVELTDTRQQLTVVHQALNNEMYRRPRGDDEGRAASRRSAAADGDADDEDDTDGRTSVKKTSVRKPTKPRFDDGDVYNDIDIEFGLLPTAGTRNYTDFSDEDATSTGSADIVAETKFRLKSLENEAQNLEQAYRDFHHHMTNVASLPSDKARQSLKQSRKAEQEEKTASSSGHLARSPVASPIRRPVSSTPYQQERQSGNLSDDSLSELHGGALTKSRGSGQPPPQFNISNMSDDEAGDRSRRGVDERIEKSRPITVDDLEARPGSPSIVVVPGSGSSVDNSPSEPVVSPAVQDTEPAQQKELLEDTPLSAPARRLQPLSLDAAWKTQQPSLDDAWKQKPVSSSEVPQESARAGSSVQQQAFLEDPARAPLPTRLPPLSASPQKTQLSSLDDAWKSQSVDKKKEEDEEMKKWEEERRQREEDRKRQEEEAWEREQKELEKLEKGEGVAGVEDEEEKGAGDKQKTEDSIDPVMKQYMEMVQQQKQKEKEKEKPVSKKTGDFWSAGQTKTPSQSEQDISIADDLPSNNGSDIDLDSW